MSADFPYKVLIVGHSCPLDRFICAGDIHDPVVHQICRARLGIVAILATVGTSLAPAMFAHSSRRCCARYREKCGH